MTNKDALRKWVLALWSGQYEQGHNSLATINRHTGQTSYCCLGVACDVFKDDLELEVRVEPNQWLKNTEHITYAYSSAYLPDEVVAHLGFLDGDTNPLISNHITSIQANDVIGMRFVAIGMEINNYYNLGLIYDGS